MPAIHVLYIDDEPALLELGKMSLERNGEFIVDTAEQGDTGLEILQKKSYDAVISDYLMPGLDGLALLKEVRARFGTLPFLIFTGPVREEVVIEALNNGADFYLQKGGESGSPFAELARRIRILVSRRMAEHALVESEEKYRTIFENLQDMIYRADPEGAITLINPSAVRLTGFSSSNDLLGMNIGNFFEDPADRDRFTAQLQETGKVSGYLVPFKKADGTRVSVTVSSHYYHDARGKVLGVVGVVHDMTALQVPGKTL